MKRTVLYNFHKESGVTFANFGGYTMPLWYGSAKEEHINVLKNVGIFDTSHMSVFTLKGIDSIGLINRSFSRTINTLKIGRQIYGLFLDNKGYVIDDAIIYRWNTNEFMIVVNAGMSTMVIDHINSFDFNNYTIENYTDRVSKIDLQGPKSLALLDKLYGTDLFDDFPYFSFKGDFLHDGILISRSGYTGEFGFELYVSNNQAQSLWQILLKEGAQFNILPCGLAARDSLRVGACLPLSHQDIGNWVFGNNPWGFAVDQILIPATSYTYAFIGMDVRKLRDGKGVVMLDEAVIGEVLSCISEVSLTRYKGQVCSIKDLELPDDYRVKGLSAGFVKVDIPLDLGIILIISDGKRFLEVEVVKNIRPDKTARKAIKEIRRIYE